MNKIENHHSTDRGDLSAKKRGKKGSWRVAINGELCKGCNICIEFCPTDVFDNSDRLNRKGYYVPLVAKEEECTGCRVCDLMCPEFAIVVTEQNPGKSSK